MRFEYLLANFALSKLTDCQISHIALIDEYKYTPFLEPKAFVTLANENETITNKEAGKTLRIQAFELNLETNSFFCPALIVRNSYLFGLLLSQRNVLLGMYLDEH